MKTFLWVVGFLIATTFLLFLFKDSVPYDSVNPVMNPISTSTTTSPTTLSRTIEDSVHIVSITVPQGVIQAEIANTNALREHGLSDRESLAKNSGMLFIFENIGSYGFWMKDMKFALDMVWIDASKQVVGIAENVLPSSYPSIFYPPSVVKYVLELNSGVAGELGLKNGIKLNF